MRKLKSFVFLGVVAALLVAGSAAGSRQPRSDLVLAIDTIAPGVTCPTKPDNGAFKLDKWVLSGTYAYAKYGVDPATGDAIDRAFSKWESDTDLPDSTFTPTNGSGTPSVAADNVNAVFFARLGGNAIATTYVWYNRATRKVAEFDMVFNSNLIWSNLPVPADNPPDCLGGNAFDVQDIATHEAGHVVGVAHTSPNGANNAQTMYPYGQAGEVYKRSLESGDRAGANAKY